MIDLTQQTTNEDGELSTYQAQVSKKKKDPNTGKMVDTMVSEETPITVFKLLKTALLTNNIRLSQRQQQKRYNLFQKINNGEDMVSLTWFEKRLIKKLVVRTFDVIVYGQITAILNNE